MFQQGEDESLYTAWERYKRLLKRCPMHGIDLKTQMYIVLGYGPNIQSDWNINAAEFKNFYPLTHQGSHAFHKNRRKGKRFVKDNYSLIYMSHIYIYISLLGF